MRDFSASLTAASARSVGPAVGDIPARLVDPPAEILRLTTGQFLRGQVLGQDEAGLMIVQTRLAVVKLAVARSLAVGSEVILQVRAGGAQTGVTLVPLEASSRLPITAAGETPPPSGVGREPSLPATQAGAATTLTADLISRATLLRAVLQTPPPLPLLAGLPSAEPGTELLLRILAVGSPAQTVASGTQSGAPAGALGSRGPAQGTAQPAAPGGAAMPGGQAPAGSGTPAGVPQGPGPGPWAAPSGIANPPTPGTTPGPAAAPLGPAVAAGNGAASQPAATTTAGDPAPGLRSAPQANVIQAGRSVSAALQGLSAEGAARAAGSSPASPSGERILSTAEAPLGDGRALRLTGLLAAKSNGGPAIVHTPLGTLTLKTSVELPTGSSLALEVLLPSSSKPPLVPAGFGSPWPGLESMEDSLLSQLPGTQAAVLQRALPQAGPRLSSGMLFILSAINQGNPLAWLAGPAAALERNERGDFLDRLGRELTGLSRSVETSSGEWRLFQLPLWSDEGLRELRLFLRQQGEGGGNGKDGKGDKATRFVLELELTHHGELQLDGLVQGRKFDLILRSRRHLSAVMRGDLIALFEEANAIGGYHGQLVFRPTQDWAHLLTAPPNRSSSTLNA